MSASVISVQEKKLLGASGPPESVDVLYFFILIIVLLDVT